MLLVGNTFPISLIRTRVTFSPVPVETAREMLRVAADAGDLASFWGHTNTLRAAETLLGVSLAPKTERPALILNPGNLPALDGRAADTVLILSPDYRVGYRPALGTEPAGTDIIGWQCLLAKFEPSNHDT